MGLTLIQAPACEPVTLAEAKVYLRIDGAQEDDLIKNLVKTARQAVEAYTSRSLIFQTWRFAINAGFASALGDGSYLSGDHSRGLKGVELPRSPFVDLIGSPKIVDDYGTRDIKDYRLDAAGRIARIHFGPSLASFLGGSGVIQIEFSAGYGQTAEEVPEPLRQAILIMAADLYESRVGSNDNRLLPPMLNETAIQLIKPYRVMRLA